jgi:hypothetical protein
MRILDPNATRDAPGYPFRSQLVPSEAIVEALWALIARGLVYIDFPFQQAQEYASLARSRWRLTRAGQAAATGEDVNPDDADGYLRHLRAAAPDAAPLVLVYAKEAIDAFRARCYLASAVMLGVASEAAVVDVAEGFSAWLPAQSERETFVKLLRSRRVFREKFDEFRKRLVSRSGDLPDELKDDLQLTLDAVGGVLRADRNDAGHPTGKRFTRERQHGNLTLFVPYAQRLYALRSFFLSSHGKIEGTP